MNNKNRVVTRSFITASMISYVLIAVFAFIFLLIPAATGNMFYKEALFDDYTNRIDGGMRLLCLVIGLPLTVLGLRSFLVYLAYQSYFDSTGITQATVGELDARLGLTGFFSIFSKYLNNTANNTTKTTGGGGNRSQSGAAGSNTGKAGNTGNSGNVTDYIIFPCGGCGTKIRVPKNKGNISVHCPKCGKYTDLFT